MTGTPAISNEAAMVLGLAGTAMPFASSPEEEAERWLRVLRLHGDVSGALQGVGIGEEPVLAGGQSPAAEADDAQGAQPSSEHRTGGDGEQVVKSVTELATRSARSRGAETVGTVDVLVGAMDFYGEDFDRVLRAYGTDRDEVLSRALSD